MCGGSRPSEGVTHPKVAFARDGLAFPTRPPHHPAMSLTAPLPSHPTESGASIRPTQMLTGGNAQIRWDRENGGAVLDSYTETKMVVTTGI